jgi:hypothetical protein
MNGLSREIAISGISVNNRVGHLNTNIQSRCHFAGGLVLLRHPVKTRTGQFLLAVFLLLAVAGKWLGLLQET